MMNGKKSLMLLPLGLAFLVCSVAFVGSISPAVFGQQQGTTGGGNQDMTAQNTMNNTTAQTAGALDCQTAASTLGGMVIPNPTGTCDVAVPRQGLQVLDAATGATLNNLLVINPLFEFTQIASQAAGGTGGGATTGGGNQAMVYGFAEFALTEAELPSAMRMLADTSWNVIAVHNHVIGESPKMIFAHATASGDINTLVRDARTVLDALMQGQAGNQTSTTAGGMAGNATTAGNISGSPSAESLTGGTTTGDGATAGGGVGTLGGGGGTSPDPGIGTTEGGTGGGATTGGGGATTEGDASGGVPDTTGGAAGPQVRP